MKTAFLFSIAFGIMMWIAVYVVWTVIGASGLIDTLNGLLASVLASANASNGNHLRQRRGDGTEVIRTGCNPRNTKEFAAPS